VSGCNPYLESLPNYIDGAPPWTPTNKGPWNYVPTTEARPWNPT